MPYTEKTTFTEYMKSYFVFTLHIVAMNLHFFMDHDQHSN